MRAFKLCFKFFIPFTCFIIFTTTSCRSQQPAPEVNLSIGYDQLQYLAAGDLVVTLQQAMALYHAGSFKPNKHPDLNLGIAKDNYWVHFLIKVDGQASPDLVVNLENPRLNDVSAYVVNSESSVSEFHFGDYYFFGTRKLYQNFFAFPVHLNTGETKSVFLFIKHKGNTLQVPVKLMSVNSLLSSIENNYLITGITTGVLFLTFFFAWFFYFQARARLFLLYGVYVFLLWAWVWSTEGFGFQYFYPHIPDLATRLGPGISVLAVASFMSCCLQFCKPYDHTSKLRKLLTILMYILIVWGTIPLLPFINISRAANMNVFLSVHFLLNMGSVLLLVVYLLWVAIKKSKLVWFYFSAVIVSMSCSLVLIARHSGWLDIPVTSATFMSMGIILEIILMTAGITNQYYNYKKEKEAMLEAYLAQQRAITERILLTEEMERKRIGRELHDDIGAGLTRISLMGDVLLKAPGKTEAAVIGAIVTTCRKLVGSMGEIVWSLNPENNSLQHLLAYLREELDKLLEYSAIDYSLNFPDHVDADVTLTNPQRRNLLLVTKEAVNNAVKYSQAQKIEVTIQLKSTGLFFTVYDDGIGFDDNKISSGNGIRNMDYRIKEIGGSLSILSNAKAGTTVSFNISLD